MNCLNCGESTEHAVCEGCMREIAGVVENRRVDIINGAMQSLSEEADKVAEIDPTKGKLGRGPKWMR